MTRTGDRVDVRGAQWRSFPDWQTWAALTDRAEIVIDGRMTVPGERSEAAFNCRLMRLSDKRYSLSFRSELNGSPLILRGEADFLKKSAAVEFRGRFAPAQYDALLGIAPRLRSGTADLRGNLLLTGGAANRSLPVLTASPIGNAAFQLGPFPLRNGRFDRRELFDGRSELEFADMGTMLGGVKLDLLRATLDRDRAAFQFLLTQPAPWQSTVRPRGSGECSLTRPGTWQAVAELPEQGVFRLEGAILPLRDLHIAGSGDAAGGRWEWNGEGASMTLQRDPGIGTGREVRISGRRDFRIGSADAVSGETVRISCGDFEQPTTGGRFELRHPRLEIRCSGDGIRHYLGQADEIVWERPRFGRLCVKDWSGTAEHAGAGAPSAGSFRCGAIEFEHMLLPCRTDGGTGKFQVGDKTWKIELAPFSAGCAVGSGKVSFARLALALSGDFASPDRFSFTGSGRDGTIRHGERSAECGEWDLSCAVRFLRANSDVFADHFRFEGKRLGFRTGYGSGKASRVFCTGERPPNGAYAGRVELEKLFFRSLRVTAENLSAVVPFGTGGPAGRITADKFRADDVRLVGLAADMSPEGNDFTVKGRARGERTGGACFVAGSVRADLRQGVLEYQIPETSLRRELPLTELAPLPGGWIFAGKIGGGGRFAWQGLTSDWRKKCRFTGFARNADCMAEDLSGEAETDGTDQTDIRILFRRLIAGRHEAQNGELHLTADGSAAKIADAKFSAWGGEWNAFSDREFAVRGVRLDRMLSLDGWNKPFSGKFSGKVRLDEKLAVCGAELTSDSNGVLRLDGMEPYRLLPGKGFRADDLAFAEAAVREFLYRTLKVRLLRRKDGLILRISGEGRPSRPVPFVFEDGVCRPAKSGEPGFAGAVEIGCGYRISNRELGISIQNKPKGVQK